MWAWALFCTPTGGESTRTPRKSQLIPDQPRALRVSVAKRQWLCEGALTLRTCCHQHWCLYSRLCLPLKSGRGCCRQASDPRSGQEGRAMMTTGHVSCQKKTKNKNLFKLHPTHIQTSLNVSMAKTDHTDAPSCKKSGTVDTV